jgi:hypothetical protein
VSILRGCTVTTLTCGGGMAPGAAWAWSIVRSQAASRERLNSAASNGSAVGALIENFVLGSRGGNRRMEVLDEGGFVVFYIHT